MRRPVPAVVFLVLALGSAAPQRGTELFALVIGNGSYADLPKLANPANDAADMAAALRALGFTTDLLVDADLAAMEDAVAALGARLGAAPGSTGFFYYAGHGVQSGGTNYLIPSDARIPNESFLKTKAMAAQSVLDTLQEARNGLNIVVLDACRDNPFGWSRSGSRGLSVVGSQPPGSIVAYATSAGSVAQDGEGRNGVFTQELLKHLATPGLEVKEVFNRTGAGVKAASEGRQIPAIYNQFFDDAYLAGPPSSAAAGLEPGSLSLDPRGLGISLVSGGKRIAGRQSEGGALVFEGLPAGAPLQASLATPRARGEFRIEGVALAPGETTVLDSPAYESWLRSALRGERDEAERALAARRLRRTAGIASLAAGAAGAAASGLSFLLGLRAGREYDQATDSATARDARGRVELYATIFGISAGIGGTAFAAAPILLAIGPSEASLRLSIERLDESIRSLGD